MTAKASDTGEIPAHSSRYMEVSSYALSQNSISSIDTLTEGAKGNFIGLWASFVTAVFAYLGWVH